MAESKVASLIGNELADDYVRTHLPKGRWADTWDLFKSNFFKLVIINVFTLLFFAPGIAIVYFKDMIITQMGTVYPLSSNPLFTYPLMPNMQGLQERIYLTWDLRFNALLIVAGFIASIGLAGACYSIKKLINTHGKFTIKGYFHGVKVCYFNVVFPVTVFMLFMYASLSISDWSAAKIAMGASSGGPVTAVVFSIIATVIVGIIAMWVLAVGISYKVKLKYLFKNSFVLLFGTIIQTLFMIGFSLIPVWLLLIGTQVTLFMYLAYIIFIFFGFSFIILCWLAYTQWVFDLYITPAVKSEEEARKAKLTPKQLAAEKEESDKQTAMELLAAGRSELIGRPILPIDGECAVKPLSAVFTRGDIAGASADREKLKTAVSAYEDEHKNDPVYVEYNKLFAEREKALQSNGKKGKKKKVSADNLLK